MSKDSLFYCRLSVYKTTCHAVDPIASDCLECERISDIALTDKVRLPKATICNCPGYIIEDTVGGLLQAGSVCAAHIKISDQHRHNETLSTLYWTDN